MRGEERGATTAVVAVVLALRGAPVALSDDVGHVLSVSGELQNGADAAALAGARRLSGRNRNFELQGAARGEEAAAEINAVRVVTSCEVVSARRDAWKYPNDQNQLALRLKPITAVCDEMNDEHTAVGGGRFGTTVLAPLLVRGAVEACHAVH